MKTKLLFSSLLAFSLFFSTSLVAQIGIPVQGIARDVNGTARINTQIDLTFDLYYIEGGNEVALYSPSQIETLTTDSFGVFSTVVNTTGRRPVFGRREVFLRISESGTVISDEQLNSVPYAIAADNGVPTGAIMPYIGTTAPEGWLLCDGAVIPTGEQYQALRDLHGNNTPNLGGMFLRGVGSNGFTSQNTVLNGVQDDTYLSHSHADNFAIGSGGNHAHFRNLAVTNALPVTTGGTGNAAVVNLANGGSNNTTTSAGGDHNHSITGSVSASGSNESRPVNYGVNYIIKL